MTSPNSILGERLSTCPQILVIQKAFLQRFTSYELLFVIKLVGFCYFFLRVIFTVKLQELV